MESSARTCDPGTQEGQAVAAQVDVPDGRKTVQLREEITFHNSGWLAVRARDERNDPDNWHHAITAAHSSPIYVTINDQLPAALLTNPSLEKSI